MSGIRLSSSKVNITGLGNLKANNNATLTLDDSSITNAILTVKHNSEVRNYELKNKKFENVDLSKAGNYEFILTVDEKEYKFAETIKPAEANWQTSTITISPSPLVA